MHKMRGESTKDERRLIIIVRSFKKNSGMEMLEDYNGCDHHYISFQVAEGAKIIPTIPLSAEELRTTAKCFKGSKASEPHGVPVEVLLLNSLLKAYNTCIAQGIFSNQWKLQKLTPISKGKCMLNSTCKLLEKLLQRIHTIALNAKTRTC